MERLKWLIYLLYQFELAKIAITVSFLVSEFNSKNSPDFLIYEGHESQLARFVDSCQCPH